MCGIVGMISKGKFGFAFSDKQIFTQLLYANALRGFDSTGVFSINRYGNLIAHKAAQKAQLFIDTKTYNEFLNNVYSNARIVVGHNRAATKGEKTDTNAHPFIEDNICLVHNGTLYNHKKLANTEVDSHAVCVSLAERGFEKTIIEVDGAFVFIWYNAKTKEFYITRNNERPLHMVETEQVIYFASEAGMLDWVLARNGIAQRKLKSFEINKLYTWNLDDLSSFEVKDNPVKKVTPISFPVQQMKLVTPVPHTNGYETYSNSPKVGSMVTFEVEQIVWTSSMTPVIKGTTIDKDKLEVRYAIPDYATNKYADSLLEATYIDAIVQSVYKKKNQDALIVRSATVGQLYTTVNGVTVTYAQIHNQEGKCTKCGEFIDIEDEIQHSFIRIKNNRIKSLLCPTCVDKMTYKSFEALNGTTC